MRRVRMFAAFLMATALAVSACGGGSGATKASELTLYNDKGAWKPYFEQVGKKYADANGVTVKPVGYTDAPAYDAFVKASLRTNRKPDVFTWHTGEQLNALAKGRHLADTSALWDKAIKDGHLTEDLKRYYTVDGKQYCVPLNVAYWVMFYNKKIFDTHGLQPPKTWDDLMAAADTLVAKGVTPFYHTSVLFSFVWFQQLMVGTDPELYNRLARGEASYTDPKVLAVMERWKGMIDKKYFVNPGDKTDPAVQLKSGKAAMVLSGTWFNTSLTQGGMKPGSDYSFFVVPNVDSSREKTSLVMETGPLCVLDKAPKKDASLKFLEWWLQPEAQEQWANSRGDVSANPKVSITDPALGDLTKQAGTGTYPLENRYFEATPPPILTAALDAFGAFVVKPADYRKQMETLQKAADDYWKQNGK